MSTLLYPDEAEVTPVTRDPVTGEPTKGTSFRVACYWRDENRDKRGPTGEPYTVSAYIVMPDYYDVAVDSIIKLVAKGTNALSGEPECKVMLSRLAQVGTFGQREVEAA